MQGSLAKIEYITHKPLIFLNMKIWIFVSFKDVLASQPWPSSPVKFEDMHRYFLKKNTLFSEMSVISWFCTEFELFKFDDEVKIQVILVFS